MDARITKTRLGNLISYDWLKMLACAAAAVVAICIIFTSIRTMPADTQIFTVYAYELVSGTRTATLEDDLSEALSYDILDTSAETITASATGSMFSGMYAGAMYSTRLTNPARTVMFVSHLNDPESLGYDAVHMLVGVNHRYEDKHGFLEMDVYLADCRTYLARFFFFFLPAALDEAAPEAAFHARTARDNRSRPDEARAAGVEEEKERLRTLREDYLYVMQAFEEELLSYSTITIAKEDADEESYVEAGTYNCGVALGALGNLKDLYYYEEENEETGEVRQSASEISLILFNTDLLSDRSNDLRYETVSFLAYLVREYRL